VTFNNYVVKIDAAKHKLLEYNYYATQEEPNQKKQKQHSEAVASALDEMLGAYNKTMELVHSNLRFTTSKRKTNPRASLPLRTRLKRRLFA
jgi:uncharacterized FlaG/YvyC family protein